MRQGLPVKVVLANGEYSVEGSASFKSLGNVRGSNPCLFTQLNFCNSNLAAHTCESLSRKRGVSL